MALCVCVSVVCAAAATTGETRKSARSTGRKVVICLYTPGDKARDLFPFRREAEIKATAAGTAAAAGSLLLLEVSFRFSPEL